MYTEGTLILIQNYHLGIVDRKILNDQNWDMRFICLENVEVHHSNILELLREKLE